MRKYSRQDWDDILQKLMKMMQEDYPNNYELVITSFGAEIKSNQTDMCFTVDEPLKEYKSAHWIACKGAYSLFDYFKCSKCGRDGMIRYPFCPYCGEKLEEGSSND